MGPLWGGLAFGTMHRARAGDRKPCVPEGGSGIARGVYPRGGHGETRVQRCRHGLPSWVDRGHHLHKLSRPRGPRLPSEARGRQGLSAPVSRVSPCAVPLLETSRAVDHPAPDESSGQLHARQGSQRAERPYTRPDPAAEYGEVPVASSCSTVGGGKGKTSEKSKDVETSRKAKMCASS